MINDLRNVLRRHWLGVISPVLLCVVALNQLYLYNTDHLNRWKGGGFGMFSTIHRRYVHVHLMNQGALECAEHHRDFRRHFRKIANYPNDRHLEKLSHAFTQREWVYSFGSGAKKKPTSVRMIGTKDSLAANDRRARFDAVEVQVFDVSFTRPTMTVWPRLLRQIRHKK
jgi:hypothetical protein